ncbi:MAG: AMP-binding protein [Microbacteriaceae bacterium]|nr:AMP-binding protein [Microbacteriaceae bacterium]MCI1206866.1 AMP-binding protein [Microbacteriaceae bacterium]
MAVLEQLGRPVEVVLAQPPIVLERLRVALSGGAAAAFEPAPVELFPVEQRAVGSVRVPDEVDVVVRTSGSTGHPKRVLLSAAALRASAHATEERLGSGQWLLALPVNYIAGLQVLVRGLLAGTEPAVCRSVHFTAEAFLHAVETMTGRDRFTALVPTQLATLLAHPDAAAALATFRAVLVGGQRMVPRLAERAEALGIRVVSTYGGTETSGGCVYDGVPLPGVRVKTVGESIRVSGPVLASGYLESGHQGRSEFLTEGSTRWFRTGDRGQLRDGLLTVHGREDQLIVTGGLKLDLEEVEEALHELPGLDSAVVAPFADEKWGTRFAGYTDGSAGQPRLGLDTINAHLHQRLGRHATAAAFTYLDFGLPRLPSGKVDRRSLSRTAAALTPTVTAAIPLPYLEEPSGQRRASEGEHE